MILLFYRGVIILAMDVVVAGAMLVAAADPTGIAIVGLVGTVVTAFSTALVWAFKGTDRANARIANENDRLQRENEYKDRLIRHKDQIIAWHQARAVGINAGPAPVFDFEREEHDN